MRLNYFIFLLTCLVLISCNKAVNPEQVVIYNFDDFNKKIIIKDTFCEGQAKRAIKDIKNGKISLNTYYLYSHYQPKSFFNKGELEHRVKHYLEDYKITLDTNFMVYSDIRTACDGLFDSYCYEKAMKNEITKRHRNLIVNLVKEAEKQHILENPDNVYSSSDIDSRHDNLSGRKFADYKDRMELDFAADFNYPTDYKSKAERSFSYTSAEFILMKDGRISNLNVEVTLQNPVNTKFKAYFENNVKDFVEKTKWVTGTIHEIPVNTEMSFTFFHK